MSRKIEVLIVGDEAALTRSLGRASAQVNTFARSMDKSGRAIQNTGRSLTRNLTLPIALAGGAAVKTAVDFNTSMTHIQALVGANTKQMALYEKSILALAPAVGKGPKELSDALYFITSSGFQGAAALKVLTASAKASAAGLGDTQTVADLVTSAINAYGHSNLTAAKATDVLTSAVRLGKAEPADFVTALGRVIPVAQAMGVSFGELSGAVASLTINGQNTEIAATGIRQVLLNILKPTADAEKALKGVGLSAKGLQSVVATQGILPALELLNTKFHGNRQEMSRVISNARSLTVALSLIGPNAGKAAGIISQVGKASGDTAKAFDTASKSAQFKFNQSLAELQVTGVKVGTDLIPVLITVAQEVGGVAKAFGQLSPTMQHVIIDGALVLAALGPITSAAGAATRGVGLLAKAYDLLTPASAAASASVKPIATGLEGVGVAAASAETGVVAADAAAVGATGSLTALAGSTAVLTGGLSLVVAGAIGLAVYFNRSADAGDNLNSVMGTLKASIEGVAGASRSALDASQSLKQGHLDVRTSARAVTDAEKAYQKAVHASGRQSEAARAASDALTQARINHENALTGLGDKLKTYTAATKTARHEENVALSTVKSTTGAYKRLNDSLGGGAKAELVRISATKQYSDTLHAQADALRASAAKVEAYNPKLAALERAEAKAADAAARLASNINNLPTHKDIYIATHFSELHTGTHKNVDPTHHALGGMAYAGQVSLVGERGPELRIEGSNARYIPAAQTRQMLAGAGGGDHLHIHIDGGTFIGGPTRQAAEKWADAIGPILNRRMVRQ